MEDNQVNYWLPPSEYYGNGLCFVTEFSIYHVLYSNLEREPEEQL